MKKNAFFFILLGVMLAFCFAACDDTPPGGGGDGNPFVGTWKTSPPATPPGYTFTFRSNLTFTHSGGGGYYTGTYTYNGNDGVFTPDSNYSQPILHATIVDNKFTAFDNNDVPYGIFFKQ